MTQFYIILDKKTIQWGSLDRVKLASCDLTRPYYFDGTEKFLVKGI